ncbi:hypothetical protein PR202_gb12068 [Eleusine coracana subsp. coracana]|uniref:NB-ARC domain-containing protein n=1 Tax=Eleusine coracana subsp. coracana TaxID=191504 RepID=A0AAV5EQF8_ELECO|nr:hypothetical protein PR202_gb12068 [Eleusine coracana subsp. coracana]
MEALLSAILGELTARSIKLLISKISKPNVSDMEDRLHHVLLRAQVIVDEAMGRHITNQAMLCQLDMLRDVMHRGSYTLDTFRYISHEEGPNDMAVSRCPSLGRVNSLKSFCFSSRDTPILEKLQEVLDDLSSMILDMQEFVVFLMSYPCRYHQPYSMHLLLHNCMFGYQMEAELVINFLLHRQSHGTQELEVLPIFGPGKVGKSTLVAHVCKDERVRAHFTEILFLRDCEFSGDELATFRQGCAMRHQNRASNWNKDERLVVVVELHGDLNEDEWSKFYTTSKRYLPSGSKIIVTSRSEMIVKFGTTQALNLKHLSREAYWYFFKTLTFGSTDPGMHPRLASLAMEIAKLLDGTLFRASITACVLRENFDINFWCRVRAFLRAHPEACLQIRSSTRDRSSLLSLDSRGGAPLPVDGNCGTRYYQYLAPLATASLFQLKKLTASSSSSVPQPQIDAGLALRRAATTPASRALLSWTLTSATRSCLDRLCKGPTTSQRNPSEPHVSNWTGDDGESRTGQAADAACVYDEQETSIRCRSDLASYFTLLSDSDDDDAACWPPSVVQVDDAVYSYDEIVEVLAGPAYLDYLERAGTAGTSRPQRDDNQKDLAGEFGAAGGAPVPEPAEQRSDNNGAPDDSDTNAAAAEEIISDEEYLGYMARLPGATHYVDCTLRLDLTQQIEMYKRHAQYRIRACKLLQGKPICHLLEEEDTAGWMYTDERLAEKGYFMRYERDGAFGWVFHPHFCKLAALDMTTGA